MKNTIAPFYFLTPGDPSISNFRNVFASFNNPATHTLALDADIRMVEAKDVAMVQQIILALQHYPHLIHKFLFCLKFTFTNLEEDNYRIPETIWKKDPIYYEWFQKMAEIPFMLYFIHDEDARLYSLMGDIIATGKVKAEETKSGKPAFTFTPDQLDLLHNRLFHACLSLLVFCHGSGFDPGIYVRGIIASFDEPFTYEDVLCEYAKDVLKGSFRTSVWHS
jgi:hypothetical protein